MIAQARARVAIIRAALPAGLLVVCVACVACTGGSGSLPGTTESREPAESSERGAAGPEHATVSNERGGNTSEPADETTEAAGTGSASSGGATGFSCSGAYACHEEGKSKTSTIVLQTTSDGKCSVSGQLVLGEDGSLTVNGQRVGSWTESVDGFSVTTSDGTTDCVPATTSPGTGAVDAGVGR